MSRIIPCIIDYVTLHIYIYIYIGCVAVQFHMKVIPLPLRSVQSTDQT